MVKSNIGRNRNNGQYSYTSGFDRLCKCGHTLGTHTGEAPHECINEDVGNGEPCTCLKFKLAPVAK